MAAEGGRSPRRLWWGVIGALVVAILAVVPARASVPPLDLTPTPALTVLGNHIVQIGLPYHFYGVNRDTLEWGRYNWGGCGGDGHFTNADFDRIKSWNVTAVRFPLSEAGWLGRRCDANAYARAVDAAVFKANARGMYAILDLHWSDVGGRAPCDAPCTSGQQPMPDADSLAFWHQVAQRYALNPGVIFDLFNEPHGVSWSCWRNGGCSVRSETTDPATGHPVRYRTVGMQQLVDTVRATGALNLVLVPGLDWGYDLAGVGRGYAVTGINVAYDTHVYTQWHYGLSDWAPRFGRLTSRYPVIATEFGSIDCRTNITRPLIDYFAAPGGDPSRRMSWTIWGWNSPGDCTQPSLIADWSGTPLPAQGTLIHDRLSGLQP